MEGVTVKRVITISCKLRSLPATNSSVRRFLKLICVCALIRCRTVMRHFCGLRQDYDLYERVLTGAELVQALRFALITKVTKKV